MYYKFKNVKQKKIHIVCLVIFHLVIFLGPLTIKTTHHHSFATFSIQNYSGYSKAEKQCLICQFEFVRSIVKESIQYDVYQPETACTRSIKTNKEFNKIFNYFSNRAPPLT